MGGGGVTGAAYEIAALMALRMATGFEANDADVVVGTSAGSFVTALLRHDRLGLDWLVWPGDTRDDVAGRIAGHVYTRDSRVKVGPWLRHGVLKGLRRPGLTMLLGSPARYSSGGLAQWVRNEIGEHAAETWPDTPTVVTAFDIAAGRRVAFGTELAPDVGMADAVAASSAIPLLFRPWDIDGRLYVDGGVASGTHADLVLGAPEPLDLVIVLAPMAAEEDREGAWFHERMFDRVGRTALGDEITRIRDTWPETDVLVLRPSRHALAAMRPNPMDTAAAVPSFIRTLIGMRKTLGSEEIWTLLERHLGSVPAASD